MKHKNKYFLILSSFVITGAFIFMLVGSGDSSSSSSAKATKDCPKSEGSSYSQGYASGKTSRLLGGSSSCSSYVDKYNYSLGRDVLKADDCFCEGFDDGYAGNAKKQ